MPLLLKIHTINVYRRRKIHEIIRVEFRFKCDILHCSEPMYTMYTLMKPVDIKGIKLLFKILE